VACGTGCRSWPELGSGSRGLARSARGFSPVHPRRSAVGSVHSDRWLLAGGSDDWRGRRDGWHGASVRGRGRAVAMRHEAQPWASIYSRSLLAVARAPTLPRAQGWSPFVPLSPRLRSGPGAIYGRGGVVPMWPGVISGHDRRWSIDGAIAVPQRGTCYFRTAVGVPTWSQVMRLAGSCLGAISGHDRPWSMF
jgi:hypothetical protein